MSDLKPCPFCGGRANFLVKTISNRGIQRGWEFGIYCTKCDVTTAKTNYRCEVGFRNGIITVEVDERPDAIEAWNRRADDE